MSYPPTRPPPFAEFPEALARRLRGVPTDIALANLMQWADAIEVWPAYLTEGERGAGFAEVARHVLMARLVA